MYKQRKEVMDLTDTGLASCVNHADRRLGCWLAMLQGLSLEEVKSIGLWQSSQCDKHYSKYSSPNTCAKLSGFSSSLEYDIPRSRISIDQFVQQTGEASEEFFKCFMGFLYDPHVLDGVNQLLIEGFNAPKNCYDALAHLHLVMFQDLYLYYDYNKELRMFKASMFRDHASTFHQWMDHCRRFVQDGEHVIRQPRIQVTQFDSDWASRVDKTTKELQAKVDTNGSKLDRLIHLVETSKHKGADLKKDRTKMASQIEDLRREDSSTKVLTNLRPLRGKQCV